LRCANCSDRIDDFSKAVGSTYCSKLCAQEAGRVRYLRRCRASGSERDPKVKEATQIKLAHIVNGGYDRPKVPERMRRAVIDRDRGLCCLCGALKRRGRCFERSSRTARYGLRL
jgi:hypothetical protein